MTEFGGALDEWLNRDNPHEHQDDDEDFDPDDIDPPDDHPYDDDY